MANLDQFAARGYASERDRHRTNATRALLDVKRNAEALLAELNGETRGLANPRQLPIDSAEAYAQLQAYEALRQVSFLVEDSPEKR